MFPWSFTLPEALAVGLCPREDGELANRGLGCFSVKTSLFWCLNWCLKVRAADKATELCSLLPGCKL